MTKKYILSLDQGTSSSRAIVFDKTGKICSVAQKEFKQIYPKPNWVEHSANSIWRSQISVAIEAISEFDIHPDEIASIGITNQRETTILWDKRTGKAVYNAIVWQDRRTNDYCNYLKENGYSATIKEKTGLEIDPYFSATKIKWILDNVSGVREKAEKGDILFGTVDTWLIWNLTGGKMHLTDVSNASRTMLFNIKTLEWDKELLEIFDIPENILPQVRNNSDDFGKTLTKFFGESIPINGVAGDQQSALFGELCTSEGMVKNTYGTGCFMMLNTGKKLVYSENKLISTIAWRLNNETFYALEGSVFIGGAVVQWLRDGLGIIKNSNEVENLAKTVSDNGGIIFIPAFTGLGAPYWNAKVTGTISGITRGTKAGHIARAALEAIAFQSNDVLSAMEKDYKNNILSMRVDGGASVNNLLMQFQSDISNLTIERPKILESTALGVAFFAGLYSGFWQNIDELKKYWISDKKFTPDIDKQKRKYLLDNWKKVINVLYQIDL